MGVSFYWRPIAPSYCQHLNIGPRSAFMAAMTRALGPYPWRLTMMEIGTLRGIVAGLGDDGVEAEIEKLIEAIRSHEAGVEVDAVY